MKRVGILTILLLAVCLPAVAYKTPTNNLSLMIRRSGPFNGVNPTLKHGEVYVPLPHRLDGVTMLWQRGSYRGGWYRGYLEAGDWVYAWVAEDCKEYILYKLSRGRCGNPAKPGATFRKMKPAKVAITPIPEGDCIAAAKHPKVECVSNTYITMVEPEEIFIPMPMGELRSTRRSKIGYVEEKETNLTVGAVKSSVKCDEKPKTCPEEGPGPGGGPYLPPPASGPGGVR